MGLSPAVSSLCARKRNVSGSGARLQNVRSGQSWLSVELSAALIRRAVLVIEHSIAQPGQAHLMLRVDLQPGAAPPCLLFTVNPHEREGEAITGRMEGRHGIVYQALDGRALEKLCARMSENWVSAWELSLKAEEILRVVESFVERAGRVREEEKFSYRENNCSVNLWRAVFAGMPSLLEGKSEETISGLWLDASRGASAAKLAQSLGILRGPAYPVGGPGNWSELLAGNLLRCLQTCAPEEGISPAALDISPKRNALLKELYGRGAVRADWLSFLLGDKLLAGIVVRMALGPEAPRFHPAVIGVKELLVKYELVNIETGEWSAGREELRAALRREFLEGYVLKACLTYGSKDGSFFHEEEKILGAILDPAGQVYTAEHFLRPCQPPADYASFAFASGEGFFLMGKLSGSALAGGNEAGRSAEVRAHSFEAYAVPGALHSRWDGDADLAMLEPEVLGFVERFLRLMPAGFRARQAYSYDLLIQEKGEIRILEINTNRGLRKSWSDYLREPGTLAAHARLLRNRYGWSFAGREGELLLGGQGNIVNHLRADLEFLVQDERAGAPRRKFWESEMRQGYVLAQNALDLEIGDDRFGYLTDVKSFAEAFVQAWNSGWDRFVAWARAEVESEEAR